ncbi:hypothetical protein PHMEG_00012787 [Phytophthora megakarya]|uniref:Uncharacterized protein n=1 Tax=Phytophthora megakarya TaxID=4795 RepID=A0A225W7X2_9STRA|nr:hypothetical protein PHMEG_00012787 [Phytophthora megakarya]
MPTEKWGLLSSPDSSISADACHLGRSLNLQRHKFKDIWQVLRRKGRTAKPPPLRSLDCRFRYAKPGCSVDGDEGVDYFLGEIALVNYYSTSDDSEVTSFGGTEKPLKGGLLHDQGDETTGRESIVAARGALRAVVSDGAADHFTVCRVTKMPLVTIGTMEEANYR